jgi:glycosyltransferase involved in cell wall biosynthesis
MTVCYFGIYDPQYARNVVLMQGLLANGVRVIECNSRAKGLKKYKELFWRHQEIKNDYDVMVVGFLGQLVVPFAWLITRKPIVLDAYLSIYESMVFDRKIHKAWSLRGRFYFMLDWLSSRLAKRVILDTYQHIKYFIETFHLPESKFGRIWIGSNDNVFYPRHTKHEPNEKLQLLYWGRMVPLQGVEFILQAAKILEKEPIEFTLIGGGAEKPKMVKLKEQLSLSNVKMLDHVPQPDLIDFIEKADICFGVFGATNKTQRVISVKIFEGLASGKAVITSGTPATREVLVDGEHCVFCRAADPRDLADKILYLKDKPDLRKQLGENAYKIYLDKFNPKALGRELVNILNNLDKK